MCVKVNRGAEEGTSDCGAGLTLVKERDSDCSVDLKRSEAQRGPLRQRSSREESCIEQKWLCSVPPLCVDID